MNITIDGDKYELDTEALLQLQPFLKIIKKISKSKKNVHLVGNTYRDNSNEKFILACVDTNHSMCLISLTSGNRFNNPVYTIDYQSPNEDEWAEITAGGNFIKC
jgi:hypothetical protein